MAFGQQSGPPASAKQIQHLEALLAEAGHESFREARYPLGLTQRQAGGKFTSNEATELIELLEAGGVPASADERASLDSDKAARALDEERLKVVAGLPSEVLVDELGRRGWICSPPL